MASVVSCFRGFRTKKNVYQVEAATTMPKMHGTYRLNSVDQNVRGPIPFSTATKTDTPAGNVADEKSCVDLPSCKEGKTVSIAGSQNNDVLKVSVEKQVSASEDNNFIPTGKKENLTTTATTALAIEGDSNLESGYEDNSDSSNSSNKLTEPETDSAVTSKMAADSHLIATIVECTGFNMSNSEQSSVEAEPNNKNNRESLRRVNSYHGQLQQPSSSPQMDEDNNKSSLERTFTSVATCNLSTLTTEKSTSALQTARDNISTPTIAELSDSSSFNGSEQTEGNTIGSIRSPAKQITKEIVSEAHDTTQDDHKRLNDDQLAHLQTEQEILNDNAYLYSTISPTWRQKNFRNATDCSRESEDRDEPREGDALHDNERVILI